ncbi:MAG: hypothetical protein A3F24_02960 [Candidatus Colwellbacteria bacterium RIFCSPHIGHO2_12_FULL_44_17]|uniref:Phospho-N-acetylmuramoyl-pentapeptide-transferase n=1 Tax=Candidatus Colwellbacteria bacterium RIFCSPHIGHO2_12_FULL_44_17 TaxID=1797689 RepID=A0A1G1Z677_9BACT|nr:MAG: hypothetical protein A3F24_02960 [Candidatus Colwellbacteria bacterium RIFCSPHIGHO2_12_FULL_44_17]
MAIISQSILFLLISALLGFLCAPVLRQVLIKYRVVREAKIEDKLGHETRINKAGTPVMGGLLVILVTAFITVLFNWDRSFSWVPIGVMLFSAALGGVDDLLNIFGRKRRIRSVTLVKTLSKVHKGLWGRLWYKIVLPFARIRGYLKLLGSNPGKGIQVHEKLFLQFLAGLATAWWLFFKLGPQWKLVWLPFSQNGGLDIGWLLIPIIILIVMATANAVNLADGLDGLAGGTLISGFGGLLIISWFQGNTVFAVLNATVIGALLAYTYFNIKPARFQMGDVGSLGLGTLLAVMTIAQNRIIILPLLGFIFFVELFSVIIQVIARHGFGKRLFLMAPLHHHFELKGWPEEKIVARFWILNGLAVALGAWLSLH